MGSKEKRACQVLQFRSRNGVDGAPRLGAESGQTNVLALRVPELAEQCAIEAKTAALVSRLRFLLQQSILKPRQDWDKACMLIAADPNVTLERYATAFFHGLEVQGIRRFRFFNVEAVEVSTDEMWMIQLLTQLQAENYASARYLAALRIKPQGRRRLLFLAEGLARGLNQELTRSEV